MRSVREVKVKVSKGPEMFFLCLEVRDAGGHLLYTCVTVRRTHTVSIDDMIRHYILYALTIYILYALNLTLSLNL